jgi:uncharacterized protein (TIGR03083 family)
MAALDLWADGQRAMSALGRTISASDAEREVPACPSWTVRQVYAHQAGAAADILAGRLEGAGSDPWTSRQVAERADRSLEEILDEWDEAAPALVTALAPLGDKVDPRVLLDLWHHHQDVRGALGLPGETSGPLTDWVMGRTRSILADVTEDFGMVVRFGTPPARPEHNVLVVEPFEAARAVLGRRSYDQIRAWSWGTPDKNDVVGNVPVFRPRREPLEETTA